MHEPCPYCQNLIETSKMLAHVLKIHPDTEQAERIRVLRKKSGGKT